MNMPVWSPEFTPRMVTVYPSGLLQFSVTVAMRRFVYPAEISGMLTAPASCCTSRPQRIGTFPVIVTSPVVAADAGRQIRHPKARRHHPAQTEIAGRVREPSLAVRTASYGNRYYYTTTKDSPII